jgi:hypothetical protein
MPGTPDSDHADPTTDTPEVADDPEAPGENVTGADVLKEMCALLDQAGVAWDLNPGHTPELRITEVPHDIAQQVVALIVSLDHRVYSDGPGSVGFGVHAPGMTFGVSMTPTGALAPKHELDALVAARAVLELHNLTAAGQYATAIARHGLYVVALMQAGHLPQAYYDVALKAIERRPELAYGQQPDVDESARTLAVLILDTYAGTTDGWFLPSAFHAHPELVTAAALLDKDPAPRVSVSAPRARQQPAAEHRAEPGR